MKDYDYIIVGAGSSGCALAERLSRDPAIRVALLEAGRSDRSILVAMPAGVRVLYEGAAYNWKFMTMPQPELASRRIYIPRGKGIGGSSSINSMIAIHGAQADFEEWAAVSSPLWGAKNIRRILREIEDASSLPETGKAERGLAGPIRLSRRLIGHELSEAYIDACAAAGIPRNEEGFNGESQFGAGFYDVNIHGGRRHGASRFLALARGRSNLEVLTRTQVSRIRIENGTAQGVVIRSGGEERILRAAGEVILSAGAIASPQLLMLSGVGPAEELRRHGIVPAVDAPEVGKNLKDHLDCSIRWASEGVETFTKYFRPYSGLFHSALAGGRYLLDRSGDAATQGIEAGAFWADPGEREVEFQSHLILALKWPPSGPHPRDGFALRVCQLKPRSVGEIRLASADPTAAPVIDPRFLSESDDLTRMTDGIQRMAEVVTGSTMRRYIGRAFDADALSTDRARVSDWIRRTAETVYHPVGTCRMGNDGGSVVDSALRVRGVRNLRVADASIMPTILRGNTNLACMAIGVIAGDIIREATSGDSTHDRAATGP